MIYFTSDTHFFHKNILDFTNRPFKTLDEMNESLIHAWNSTVNNQDTIYHLGDISFCNQDDTIEIVKQLKGNIIVIKGNHDDSGLLKKLLREGIIEDWKIADYMKYNKRMLWLSHIPMDIAPNRNRMWSIHGHIHEEQTRLDSQINVGVDSQDFNQKIFGQPISIKELFQKIEEKEMIRFQ